MAAYTEPRRLPAEYVQAGDLVHIINSFGDAWVTVVNVTECDAPDCPDHHSVNVQYPATTVHYGVLDFLTVRIPVKSEPTAPAGPADGDRVWLVDGTPGAVMHRMPDVAEQCGWPKRQAGVTCLAAEAVEWWQATRCPRCWPGAT